LDLEVVSAGVRAYILPGGTGPRRPWHRDGQDRAGERPNGRRSPTGRHGAKKAAEANLIVRCEETAVMRGQADTAKLLADNATLMRFRGLKVLEKVACADGQ